MTTPVPEAFSAETGPLPDMRKGEDKMKKLLALALALVLAAVAALYVVPLFISHPHDPHEDMALLPPEKLEPGEFEPTGETGANGGVEDGTGEDSSQDLVARDREEADRLRAELLEDVGPGEEEGVEADADPREGTDGATDGGSAEATGGLDTSERPKLSEFRWFTNDMMNGNAPSGPAAIGDFSRVQGGWKAYIYTYSIPGNAHSQSSEELLNVHVGGTEDKATLVFDWYYTRSESGEAHENGQPDTLYSGTWEDGVLDALGTGSVRLTKFWEEDGAQFAIGRIGWPDAMDATIGMVRP